MSIETKHTIHTLKYRAGLALTSLGLITLLASCGIPAVAPLGQRSGATDQRGTPLPTAHVRIGGQPTKAALPPPVSVSSPTLEAIEQPSATAVPISTGEPPDPSDTQAFMQYYLDKWGSMCVPGKKFEVVVDPSITTRFHALAKTKAEDFYNPTFFTIRFAQDEQIRQNLLQGFPDMTEAQFQEVLIHIKVHEAVHLCTYNIGEDVDITEQVRELYSRLYQLYAQRGFPVSPYMLPPERISTIFAADGAIWPKGSDNPDGEKNEEALIDALATVETGELQSGGGLSTDMTPQRDLLIASGIRLQTVFKVIEQNNLPALHDIYVQQFLQMGRTVDQAQAEADWLMASLWFAPNRGIAAQIFTNVDNEILRN